MGLINTTNGLEGKLVVFEDYVNLKVEIGKVEPTVVSLPLSNIFQFMFCMETINFTQRMLEVY